MESFERYCRLCAKEEEATILIFGMEGDSMQIKTKLNKYLNIEIDKKDNLPKCICVRCCNQLNNVCKFIVEAQNAQEMLLKNNISLKNHYLNNNRQTPNITINTRTYTKETFEDTDGNKDVTYLNAGDGENVTLTRLKADESVQNTDINRDISKLKVCPCKLCNIDFASDIEFRSHVCAAHSNYEKSFKCTICEKEFKLKNQFVVHIKNHSNIRKCPLCNRSFRTEKNLKSHMNIHSSKSKSYECKECGRTYPTLSGYRNHSVTHSNERPFSCIMCKKKFKRYQALRFHINKHTGEKPFKCPYCDKRFASTGTCSTHRTKVHPTELVSDMAKKKGKNDSQKSTSVRPITTNLNINRNLPLKLLNKYQCEMCSHSFNKKDNYTYHMYKHTGVKPFNCNYCPEKFVTQKGLYLHYEKCHAEKDRPLVLLTKNMQLK